MEPAAPVPASASPEITATFKILIVGDSGVGKSSILLRFTDDHFLPPEETSATIGVDFKVKMYDLDDQRYKLTIWDTAGQERFRTLTSSYYRGAQGVILVYDLNTYCSNEDVVKMIIGNKIDKEAERQVSRKEGSDYARKHQTLFLECSAKTKIGVQQAMGELVGKVVETPSLWRKSSPGKGTVYVNDSVPSGLAGGCSC
ncbi:hypothetical protein GGI05_004458 [Coemansia sp. RSA 2603]|nr:hypothetical protein GGI05_004458 [Coemansia sp. RSA 2603]